MTLNLPEPWEHVKGYRLNADGKAIEYKNPENHLVAYIEATIDEYDENRMVYIPSIIAPNGEFVEYPETIRDKESALERLRGWAEKYAREE